MNKKPWPIIILALLFIVEPLCKLLFYSWYWHRDISFLLTTTPMKSPYMLFMYFLACPIAGVSIFAVKKWSLPVFLTIEGLILVGHFYNRLANPHYFSSVVFCFVTLLNIGVVRYFLIPAVRLAYIDPKFRWWESKPRYNVNWNCLVKQDGFSENAVIANVAEGGVLLSIPASSGLRLEHPFGLDFKFKNFSFNLIGKILYQKPLGDKVRYGVKFQSLSTTQLGDLRRCVKTLERQGFPRRPKRENIAKSFRLWVRVLLNSPRKALLPVVNRPCSSKNNDSDSQQKTA